jgi:CMP-N,N'-diacetyllegionaminic acid synthase
MRIGLMNTKRRNIRDRKIEIFESKINKGSIPWSERNRKINSTGVLAIVPARAGSKRLPSKNFRRFADSNLVAITVSEALLVDTIEKIVVATDVEDLKPQDLDTSGRVSIFRRSLESATDNAPTAKVISEVLDAFPNFETVLLLQPTSPQRNHTIIRKTLDQLQISSNSSVISYSIIKSSMDKVILKLDSEKFTTIGNLLMRVEDMEEAVTPKQILVPNGMIYAAKTVDLKRVNFDFYSLDVIPLEMEFLSALDIDDQLEFEMAEFAVKSASR